MEKEIEFTLTNGHKAYVGFKTDKGPLQYNWDAFIVKGLRGATTLINGYTINNSIVNCKSNYKASCTIHLKPICGFVGSYIVPFNFNIYVEDANDMQLFKLGIISYTIEKYDQKKWNDTVSKELEGERNCITFL